MENTTTTFNVGPFSINRPQQSDQNPMKEVKQTPQDGEVWLSRAMSDPRLVMPLESDVYLEDSSRLKETWAMWQQAIPYGPERAPSKMYNIHENLSLPKIPEFFKGGGFCVVSERIANILNAFELGKSSLYPVKIFEHDRSSEIDGTYYSMSFGERRETFDEKASVATNPIPHMKTEKWSLLNPKHDNVVVLPTAIGPPDLWLDPKVFKEIFISGRLARALNGAGLGAIMRLTRCRIANQK